MGRYEFDVDGMQCAGCENLIETEVEEVRGVLRAEADYREERVEVVADPDDVREQAERTDEVTERELAEELERLGYEPRE